MSWTLAVDTSLSHAQIALFKDQQFVDAERWEKQKSHSEIITLAYQKLMKRNKITEKELSQVAGVVGPGSFTGIRVGINFCKALAYSFDLPCLEINKLRLQVAGLDSGNGLVASVIDAQKNSVFISIFDREDQNFTAEVENQVVPISDLSKLINKEIFYCGQGFENYHDFIDSKVKKLLIKQDHISDLKFLFEDVVISQKQKAWFEMQPLYIKGSAPEEKLNPTQMKL